MPKMKFTALSVKNIKAPVDRKYLDYSDEDTTGLKLRAYSTGTKAYLLRYKINGKQRDYTLGETTVLSLAQARADCAVARAQVKQGIDVKALRDSQLQDLAEIPTVEVFADTYISKWAKPRKKTWESDRRYLDADVIPFIGGMKIDKVTKRHINMLLDKKIDAGSLVSHNRLLSLLSKFFNFAISRGEIKDNPTLQIAKNKETKRTRILTDDEIRIFWEATSENSNLDISTRLALRMRLITGQRSSEIVSMKVEDVIDGIWHMPDTKNGRPHAIPLTSLSKEVIKQALPNARNGLLFPSRSEEVMKVWVLSQIFSRTDWKLEEGQKRPTPHDLRRTLRTGLGELNFDNFIQRKVTNHKERNEQDETYNVHNYMSEKSRALEAWNKKLLKVLKKPSPSNVVKLKVG